MPSSPSSPERGERAARLLLAAVAVAALVLLVPALRDERRVERAAELTRAARHDAAVAELRRVGGHEARVREAQTLVFGRRPAEAVPVLRAAVADEPDDLDAWRLLARAAGRSGDEALAARARARLRELDPLGAGQQQP